MAWSKYTWYRVYLPELLPKSVGRVLYLDCDVCVTDQLDELFDMDMEEKAIAGVLDPESYSDSVYDRLGYSSDKKYICAGVLMMNIHYWRKADISEKVLDYGKTYPEKTLFPDQDAINVICQDVKVILSPKYSPFLRIAKFFEKEEWNEYIHIQQSSIMQVVLHGREILTIIHFTIIGGRLSMPCRLIFGM